MNTLSYPSQNIHLPSHAASLYVARFISLVCISVILFFVLALFLDWLLPFTLFESSLVNFPTIIALLVTSLTGVLYKKNIRFQLLGIIPLTIGMITLLDYLTGGRSVLSIISTGNIGSGIIFCIVGLSIISSIMLIPHRYHFMQATILIALAISLFGILNALYHFVAADNLLLDRNTPILQSIIFFVLAQIVLFTKPDRGFIGLFTTDSHSSRLARMSFAYFATIPPFLGFMLVFFEKLNRFDAYSRLALLIVLIIVISIAITWLNGRLIYHSEVEHFLMKEALRVNNISLELNAEDLSSKMVKLEGDNQAIADKLNNQRSLVDIMGNNS